MLAIKSKRTVHSKRLISGLIVLLLLVGGVYVLMLAASPVAAPLLTRKPIDIKALPVPQKIDNRLIIPKIGVNIAYATGAQALDRGAEWRSPNSGNPLDGGNFVIAAHRFSIQPTPLGTIEKSPFYSIDKLANGDKIIVDYNGKRYGYEIIKEFSVKPAQVEIEARTNNSIMTLYSCSLSGAESDRLVIQAKLLGEVALVTS